MPKNNLFVFDIETVPDTDAVRNLTGFESNNIEELRKELEEYHIKVSGGNPFPRQPFHKVVAISFVEAEIKSEIDGTESYILTDIRSGGTENSSEEEILKGFFSYLSKKSPRFVSYNGRTFDLPVLKYRAMKYGISAPWLYRSGDKWNSYTSRYSADWHCDLLDVLSDYGCSAKCKMNEVCSILGLPGKIGVDGSQVSGMYDEGRIKEIRDYCETDVINTYLVYLVNQYHTGFLSEENFKNANLDLINYLDENKSEKKKHFKEFLDEWKLTDERGFFK